MPASCRFSSLCRSRHAAFVSPAPARPRPVFSRGRPRRKGRVLLSLVTKGLESNAPDWQEERLQYLEQEARFVEIQRRADWLQEQLDSNSREKTELLKQADQFQQLLLQHL